MRIFLMIILVITFSNAKKDFYYSFIDSTGSQITQKRKEEIKNGFHLIEQVRRLAKLGKIDEAYKQINTFKKINKLKVLNSEIMITYAEMSLKKGSRRFIILAEAELETAINSALIYEEDLPKAYMLMIELKLQLNKIKEATYFAHTIINNFSDEVLNAYGKIYLAKIYRHTKEYRKATKVLYSILIETSDVLVATLVADELFDIYILDNEPKKAYDLISKVLTKNIDYYANDSYVAVQKIDKLIKADMPEFGVEILLELLKRTKREDFIEEFKYKLANLYMLMFDGSNYYLYKAKELYTDILSDFPDGKYAKKSKMYIDEILMREGSLQSSAVASKYIDSESMMQKVLLQELIDNKNAKKYEYILKAKKVYKRVSDTIAKRFGYENMDVLFDEVNILMMKDYIQTGKCSLISKAIDASRKETLSLLIKDEDLKYDFFDCLIEVPNKKAFDLAKEAFNSSRDAKLYLYLERMAYSLGFYDEALQFSSKVEMTDNKEVLSDEFLYRFLILNSKKDSISIEKFFIYASKHPEYIENNSDKPLIIDFYYQYYLYLINRNKLKLAIEVLNKLYIKQKDVKAPVYTPFVELELAKLEKNKNNNQTAIDYINESILFARSIKDKDLAKVYYELIKLYELVGNNNKKDETIQKCKNLNNAGESLYKNMCDKM